MSREPDVVRDPAPAYSEKSRRPMLQRREAAARQDPASAQARVAAGARRRRSRPRSDPGRPRRSRRSSSTTGRSRRSTRCARSPSSTASRASISRRSRSSSSTSTSCRARSPRRNRILPVLVRGDRIFLAMADPHDKRVVDELEFVTGKKVYPYIAVHSTLVKTIAAAYDAKARGETPLPRPARPGGDAAPARAAGRPAKRARRSGRAASDPLARAARPRAGGRRRRERRDGVA